MKLNYKYPQKIYNSITYDIDTMTVIDEDSYLYYGPIQYCGTEFMIFMTFVSLLYSLYNYQQMSKVDDTQGQEQQGFETNTRSTQEPLNIIYGTVKVGGNDVYATTGGDNSKELYMVQSLGEGPISGIYQDEGVDQILIDDKIYTEFGTDVTYTLHTGTDSQTYDTNINTFDAAWVDNLRNTAYIAWKFLWNEDIFRGVPERLVIIKGLIIKDFRISSNAWTDNAVLCLYDFLTNTRYGLGIDEDLIDITSWTTAANYVDTKGWSFNRNIKPNQSNAWDIVKMIMKHFRGTMQWFNGKYFLYISDVNEEASVMTINDEHIVQDGGGKAQIRVIQPSRFDKPKAVRVSYINKDLNWVQDDVIFGDEFGVIQDISYLGCTNREELGEHAIYELERAQLNRTIVGTFRDDCLELEPHDLITFNSRALNISDQLMRVTSVNLATNGLISLSLQYESEDLYDTEYNLQPDQIYTCNLPDPTSLVNIINPTIEEEIYYYRLRTFSRLNINFTVPETEPWFKHVEVWSYISSGGAAPAPSEYRHQFNTTNNFSIDPVEEGMTYLYLLRPVSIYNVKGDFISLGKYITGKNIAPQSLSYLAAVARDGGLILFSEKVDDPDVEVYEFRLGSQWIGGIFLSAKRSPQEFLYNVKPGTHVFTCNTKDTNGIYGDTPVTAGAVIILPKGWTLSDTFTDDYITDPGTFINTEHTTYGSDDYLQGSHSVSLSGSYVSNSFDTGVAANYYVYVEADVVVTGAGTTWNDMIPSATIWNDIGISTRTWNQIFEVSEAPRVEIEIHHRLTTGDAWSVIRKAEILAAVINARYFRVRIRIQDPSSEIFAKVENFTLRCHT